MSPSTICSFDRSDQHKHFLFLSTIASSVENIFLNGDRKLLVLKIHFIEGGYCQLVCPVTQTSWITKNHFEFFFIFFYFSFIFMFPLKREKKEPFYFREQS